MIRNTPGSSDHPWTMNTNAHPDPNDLAALAEGLEPPNASALMAHLAGCRSCLAAYAEAVRIGRARAQDPAAFAVPAELMPAALRAGHPAERRPSPRLRWPRPALAAAAALTVIALVGVLAPRRGSSGLDAPGLALIQSTLHEQSSTGPVFPGVDATGGSDAPVYRSGGAPQTELDAALRRASARLGAAPRDSRAAYWLSAGYLAAGQLGTATDLIRLARQAHPDDRPLRVLDGLAAYRRSELAVAERLLREALAVEPQDPVVRFDLAVVLADAGRTWEAREILAAGDWSLDAELARRAQAMRDSLR